MNVPEKVPYISAVWVNKVTERVNIKREEEERFIL